MKIQKFILNMKSLSVKKKLLLLGDYIPEHILVLQTRVLNTTKVEPTTMKEFYKNEKEMLSSLQDLNFELDIYLATRYNNPSELLV